MGSIQEIPVVFLLSICAGQLFGLMPQNLLESGHVSLKAKYFARFLSANPD